MTLEQETTSHSRERQKKQIRLHKYEEVEVTILVRPLSSKMKNQMLIQPPDAETERIYISCLGRRTDPIKNLINDAKEAYTSKKASTTTVRVPNSVLNSWTSVSTRPSRSMTTLSLSKAESTALLKDISEYLAPGSARWYAAHGIPYRRGYLFHGPPGTGKTSFSLVLAGMFGLEIHVLSLLDPGLTESKLQHLFLSMPSRCIGKSFILFKRQRNRI